MADTRIIVSSVSDEGDTVIIWGRPEHAPEHGDPSGFIFQTTGAGHPALAERASRLASGDVVIIDSTPIAVGWNRACGLTVPDEPPISGHT